MKPLTTLLRPLLIGLSLSGPASFATGAPAGPTCNPQGNQQEMNACAAQDFEAADTELNRTYREVMAGLSPSRQKALRKEQRAWLKQRDPRCKAAAHASEGGSIWPLEYLGCRAQATRQRTGEIAQWRPPHRPHTAP